jgi:S-adenosyl methyltransferase
VSPRESTCVAAIETAYASATAPAVFRKRHEVSAFFQDLTLVNPGLVDVTEWRGNGQAAPSPAYALKFLCGVAQKNRP